MIYIECTIKTVWMHTLNKNSGIKQLLKTKVKMFIFAESFDDKTFL